MGKLLFVPTSKAELVREIQRLWGEVDPRDYRRYTKILTYKIEDLIDVKGLATIN